MFGPVGESSHTARAGNRAAHQPAGTTQGLSALGTGVFAESGGKGTQPASTSKAAGAPGDVPQLQAAPGQL